MNPMTLMLMCCHAAALPTDQEFPPDVIVKSFEKWSPHSARLTADDRWLIVRDESGPKGVDRLISLAHPDAPVTLALEYVSGMSPDGQWLVGRTQQGSVLFDLSHPPTPVKIAEFDEDSRGYWSFSDDSRYLTSQGKDRAKTSWLLDTETPTVTRCEMPAFYFVSERWRVETSGENKLLFVGRQDPQLELQMEVPADARFVIASTTAAAAAMPGVAQPQQQSTSRDWLLVTAPSKAILVDLHADDPVSSSRVIPQPLGDVQSARVAPDGSWLVVPQKQSVLFFDFTKNQLRELEAQDNLTLESRSNYYNRDVTTVASRELRGPFLAESNGNGLFLWDVRQPHQRWELSRSAVKWTRFQGHDHWLLAGNVGNDLFMWDLRKLTASATK